MSQNPDGILSLNEEKSFLRRQRREARRLALATTSDAPVGEPLRPVPTGPTATLVEVPATPGPADDVALRVDSLCAAYGETQVLFDIGLDVHAGKLTALVGANGAGKSTLCKVLAGQLESTSGTIMLGGKDVTKQPAHQRAEEMLLAPESRGGSSRPCRSRTIS